MEMYSHDDRLNTVPRTNGAGRPDYYSNGYMNERDAQYSGGAGLVKRTPHSDGEKEPKGSDGKEEEAETYDNSVLGVFAGRTSLCGVAYIRESVHIITRLIWLIIFLGMLGASTWQLIGVFKKYFEHPIKTEISLGFSTLDFPTVTVCNVNPIRRSMVYLDDDLERFVGKLENEFLAYTDYFENFDDEEEDAEDEKRRKKRNIKKRQTDTNTTDDYEYYGFYNEEFYDDDDDEFEDYGEVAQDAKEENQFRAILGKIPRELRMEMGHQKELAILSCSYQGKECSAKNFTTVLSPDYGNCFQFNGISSRTSPVRSKRSGISSGLSLILYGENPQTDHLIGFTEEAGFQVSVDPFNTLVIPKDGGISVGSGFQTNIGARYLGISRLGDKRVSKESYWKCENGEGFKKNYGFNYTVQSCLDTCVDKTIANECGCMRPEFYDFYPISNRTLPSCYTTDDSRKCAGQRITSVLTGKQTCDCGHACRETTYSTKYSLTRYPMLGIWPKLVKLVCAAQKNMTAARPEAEVTDHCAALRNTTDTDEQTWILLNSFLKVNIYFESLNYESVVQSEDYPLEQFGADIGGTIGLWTGFCIFTALELFDLLIQTIIYFCWTRWTRGNQVNDNSRYYGGGGYPHQQHQRGRPQYASYPPQNPGATHPGHAYPAKHQVPHPSQLQFYQ